MLPVLGEEDILEVRFPADDVDDAVRSGGPQDATDRAADPHPDDIAVDNPTRDRWFNIDAGFERDPAKTPVAFQKRAFPFRIDGVRSMPLTFTNLSFQRSFGAGARTWQFRFDAQNIFNRQQWNGPTLNPTSTQFGQVTTVALNQMRFFSFGLRATF